MKTPQQTQDQATVRLSSPPEIVGAVPSMIGFHPEDSLVILCLHGPRHRTGAVLRVDLPLPDQMDAYAAELAGRVAKESADAVIMVCYTSEPDDDGGHLPRTDLIALLLDELLLRDIGWMEMLLVRAGRWWSYTCAKPCCPREGTALPEVPSERLAAFEAERAIRGVAVLPGREALAQSVRGPDDGRAAELRQCRDELAERLAEEVLAHGFGAVRQQTVEEARAAYRSFVRGERELDDGRALRIVLGLEDKWPRDAMITWGLTEHYDEVVAFLTGLVQRAPDENAAPVCTVLAAVAYQHGEGALASVALDRALANDPEYEMAQLLAALLDGQVNPREIRAMARRARRELAQPSIDDELQAA